MRPRTPLTYMTEVLEREAETVGTGNPAAVARGRTRDEGLITRGHGGTSRATEVL